MMKNIISILSLVLMIACCNFGFTSCSKDDEGMSDEEALKILVGTWYSQDTQYYSASHLLTKPQYVFDANKKFVSTVKDIIVNPKSTDTDKDGVLVKYEGTYSVSKGKMTLRFERECEPSKYKDSNWHSCDDVREYVFELLENEGINILHMTTTDQKTGKFYYKIK
jgi:hypothetical protein